MGDPSTSSEGSTGQARYRFRVRLPDGSDHWSDPFSAPARNLSQGLGAPRWSGQKYGHGDRAVLEVSARGLDGRKVKFLVERRKGSAWEPYSEVFGAVRGGIARAALQLLHPDKPGAKAEGIGPAQLRFSCVLVDA